MTATTAGILVSPDPRWDAALVRHTDRALWVQPIAGDDTSWLVYAVESYAGRSDGSQRSYTVTVDLSDPLTTHVACDCVAGSMGIPCQHSAAALREAGAFPYERRYVCARCGHVDTDAEDATKHWLVSKCRPAATNGAAGAALLLGSKARREGLTT